MGIDRSGALGHLAGMSSSLLSLVRPVFLVFLLAVVAGPGVAAAKGKSLAGFAGSGSGLILISQGEVSVVGNANPKVKASAKAAKFTLKCTINNVSATQVISLRKGRATVSHLLPGLSGFEASASGTYRVGGGKVRATLPFGSGSSAGTLYIQIDTTPFGATLRVSSQILYTNGTPPIYATVIAN